ncbi:Bifunctional purine biosynthetic protein ade1 [Clathrus columnatus]|uniref:Bifunctional purine biosynthetic protein ade1 n=1 Tax=Clathrus columnatus TaxID=1419009 RepID=A0AAV5A848_9AGAM|nr:Bifunctional purine biosynthetic protein ade1 [Clathrus columnatus]
MDSLSSSSSLRVLILGSGGREHALAWKIAQSDLVEKVYVAPGNAGTISDDTCIAVPIPVTDFRKLVEFSVENDVNLVITGPEQPLVDGIEPWFRKGACSSIQ